MTRPTDEMIVPEGWGFVETIDRRDFMRLTGAGLLVAIAFAPKGALAKPVWNPAGLQRPTPDFNAFVHIGADGRVTLMVGKIEMGQGASTSLPQLAAEELNVPLSMVDIVMGDTDLCPFDMGTFGSLSIRVLGPVLRAAAAEGRAVLVQMASERLGVPVDGLEVVDGVVRAKADSSKKVSYGELTAGKKIERKLTGQAAVEKVEQFTLVGHTQLRRDAREKVTGAAKYAGDIIPPGALHARILRPPAHGATLKSADTAEAEKYPGARVIRDGDFIAVLHKRRDEAQRALVLIKAEWNPSPNTLDQETIFDHVEKSPLAPQVIQSGGDLAAGAKAASGIIATRYTKGYVAHAPMETHTAVAAMGADGRITVWAGTQTPFPLQTQVARAVKLPTDKVRIITPYVGGGFGGKSASQQAIEAARLTVAAGVPVRVVWDRPEEFFFDTFDPATVINIKAGVDAAGKIVYWDNTIIAAGGRGAEAFYDIPNHSTVTRGGWQANPPGVHPFGIGPWRAPGANANCWAREMHIDALAVKAGQDPVAFRLANMTDPRMRRVLETAAKTFGWTPKTAPSKRGFGVACGIDAGTYVAGIAEVKVNADTGEVKVVRVAIAQDMGVVVNPDGAMQQLEGCVMMGLGYCLTEEVRFKNGDVLDRNFNTYALPKFSQMPKIDAVLVDNPQLPAQGGGEPAIVLMGAMLGNGLFDATGARLTHLPMSKARVKSALAAKG